MYIFPLHGGDILSEVKANKQRQGSTNSVLDVHSNKIREKEHKVEIEAVKVLLPNHFTNDINLYRGMTC